MNDRSATRVAVIVGMHRSGTSLLARLLDGLGVTFGPRVMTQSVPDNEGGYWEHMDIVTAQEALLDDVLNRPWHRARGLEPLTEDWWKSAEVLPYRLALTEVLERECAPAPHLFGFKDPRTARLLPLWLDIFRESGIEPAFVLATRAPDAVAGSLHRRQNMPPALGRLFWLQHTLEAVSQLDGSVRVVVDYDDLLVDPGAVLPRLSHALDLPDPGEDRVKELIAAIDRDQRHHVPGAGGSDEWTARVHALLAQTDEVGRFPRPLLEMAGTFRAMQPLLATSARDFEAVCDTIAAREEAARRGARNAAGAEEAVARMAYHGFRDISPRDSALLAPVQDELALTKNSLATTRWDLATTKQDLAATQRDLATTKRDLAESHEELALSAQNLAMTREFLFVQFSRLIRVLAPGQHDLLERPTTWPDQRLETARRLLARLRGYRSWRWPLALVSSRGVSTDSQDSPDELHALDQIVSVLVSRRWRYTRPLRWVEHLRRRRIGDEHPPDGADSPAQTDETPEPGTVPKADEVRVPGRIPQPVPREAPYSPLYNAWAIKQRALRVDPPGSAGRVILLTSPGDAAASAHLPAMIETLRQQTWMDWRLIVCVDDSTTWPDAAAERADPRVRILEPATRGALENALGEDQEWEWLAWLRPTDLYEPDAIAAVLAVAAPDRDVAYSDFDRIDQWGNRFGPTFAGPPVANVPFMALRLHGLALVSRRIVERAGVRLCGNPADLVHQHADWVQGAEMSRIRHVPRVLVHRKAVPSTPAGPAAVFAALRLDDVLGQYGWRVTSGPAGLAEGPGVGVEPLPARDIRVAVCVVNETGAPLAPWMMSALRHNNQALEIVVLGMPGDASSADSEPMTRRLHIVEPGANGALGELLVWLEATRPEVVVVVDHSCRPAHADAVSALISLAAADGVAVAGGVVTQKRVLCDGFRSSATRSRYLFPDAVDPRCFAFRVNGSVKPDMLSGHDTIESVAAAMCAEAQSRGLVVVVNRDAEFVCDEEARTAPYSIEEREIVDWTRRTASDRGEDVVPVSVDPDGAT